MAVKKCFINKCKSSSTRNEDNEVTYHKFPKDAKLCEKWASITHYSTTKSITSSFVCSRHFCKDDFKKNKDSKYILKSDAIPSIFSWKVDKVNMESQPSIENEKEPLEENAANISNSSKGSEAENVDNIKKFIEAQDRELQELGGNDVAKPVDTVQNVENTKLDEVEQKAVENVEKLVENLQEHHENLQKHDKHQEHVKNVLEIEQNSVEMVQLPMENKLIDDSQKLIQNDEDTMAAASSVMEMILNETEAKAVKSNDVDKEEPKQALNPGNSSMPLSVGSKVEAKDFSEEWYPAEIVEVDFDEMEVLVHYDYLKKPDEWISVSSPRLRPFTGPSAPKPAEVKPEPEPVKETIEETKEIKVEDKTKVFVVGERCLARWRDNRRFVATVDKDLGDGKFEVIFDDGVRWPCTIARLSKLKENLTVDTSLTSPSGAPSPVLPGGPNTAPVPPLAYHTHLFDPTRDYLGSKSERREKKRKINIKEIFNIGQKKPKMPKIEKEKPKERVVKKVVKPKVKEIKNEKGMSDAVASIIGTVTSEEKVEIKEEIKSEPMDVDESFNIYQQEDSLTSKSDLDPIDEEAKLERFDKPDQKMHDVAIDKIKEAIIKLEGGLIESMEAESPIYNGVESPKSFSTPKSEIVTKPVIDSPNAAIETPESDIDISKSVIDKPIPAIGTPKPTSIPIVVIERTIPDPKTTGEDISQTEVKYDIDISEMDIQSPSVIEASEAVIDNLLHDDSDATKSDIEFDTSGIKSPRLDIDKPILVDIEAPLDNDPEDEVSLPKELKVDATEIRPSKKKVKKAKKRQLQEQNEVERVKNELAAVKRKYEEVKRQMRKEREKQMAIPQPESVLAAHEWACQWMNGQPVGRVSEVEADGKPDANGKPPLPRRSVQVVDRRLPRGWTKHMVRRSVGHSAGKWDVVLIGPNNKRFHTKTDMRHFLETADASMKPYEHALLDFGNHLKLSRKLGWITNTPDGLAEAPETILPATSVTNLSPLIKKKNLTLKRRGVKINKRPIKLKLQRRMHTYNSQLIDADSGEPSMMTENIPEPPVMPIEDGYVWVGSLKVQVIDNLLRCPADSCFKNFRNNTLLQMHIKHYHRELRKMMGATPKVLDLAAARTIVPGAELRTDPKVIKVKVNKPKREEPKLEQEMDIDIMHTPTKEEKIPRSQDSPKLRLALVNKPKRPRVLLPMKRIEPEQESDDFQTEITELPRDVLDFETAISTHTVTKPGDKKKKGDKKKSFASFAKNISEDEEWFALNSDDVDTRSSFPRSGSPDSKIMDPKTGFMMSSDNVEDQIDDPPLYTLTEAGERIKIVHMRREEIINCHCGFREEDGLMVQCELCLCWQHALCHNIQKESEVPEKYTCSICLNPRRGRRSKRFLHDQDRMYEGLLPGAKQDESIRRSHELAGNLLRIEDALHALRVKYYVATKKDHPKLYLWAKDWEQVEIPYKLNTDYSDLNIMINGMDKENLPLKEEPSLDMRSEEDQDGDRYSHRDGLGSQALLSGLLSSPGAVAASLELPISTSELERLAKTVQEAAAAEWQGQAAPAPAPQPEAPIENEVCRERLLNHIQRCQALLDSRLDSIEAQVAELESQDPSFGEHYETAEKYPRIKQTVQMMLRDLDTMEELGVIT